MYNDATIGARLRILRKWRRLTQKELADLSGLSQAFLSMAERGERTLDRRSHIAALASVLRVSETELVGGPHLSADPMQSEPHTFIPALRVALLTNTLRDAAVDWARPVEELASIVSGIEEYRRRDDYVQIGQALPKILDELHFHVVSPADEVTQRLALQALVDAAHYAAIVGKNLNYLDLAQYAAQRGADAAALLDDPVYIGRASFPVVLGVSSEGARERALVMAERVANTLEPQVRDQHGLEVLGMSCLNAALAAAALNKTGHARHWLAEAGRLAGPIPDDPSTAWMGFSATNVAIWEITVGVECGQAGGEVLEKARTVETGKLGQLPYRRAGFFADTGRGLARDPRTRADAVRWLRKAEDAAPQRIRNNIRVRETIAVLMEQAKAAAGGRELRGMAARMGVPL
jgi:transcriptional regulator with XRE-family HTH domain